MFQSSVHDCTQEITAIYFLSPTVEEWCHGFRYSLRTEGRLWKRSQLRFSVERESPLLFLCVWVVLLLVSSGYRLVSDPPAPPTLSGEEGTWLSPVWVLSCNAKTVLAGKMLGETAKSCVKKTYTSYFPILKLWTISSGREDCFSAGICKNSHDSERERRAKKNKRNRTKGYEGTPRRMRDDEKVEVKHFAWPRSHAIICHISKRAVFHFPSRPAARRSVTVGD